MAERIERIYTTTNAQVKQIEKKYGRLIFTIAHRIGGDTIISSFEDSVQDLYISALDACEAYERKTNLGFEEFFSTEEFDKYIKSVMWNKKNNQGKQITKKKNINYHMTLNDDVIESDSALEYELPDVSSMLAEIDGMDEEGEELMVRVMKDFQMVKPNGSLNISRLSREMGITKKQVTVIISKLRPLLDEYTNFDD